MRPHDERLSPTAEVNPFVGSDRSRRRPPLANSLYILHLLPQLLDNHLHLDGHLLEFLGRCLGA